MNKIYYIFILSIFLFSPACILFTVNHDEPVKISEYKIQKRDFSELSADEFDICEVVFCYQFKHNASAQQQRVKYYFITAFGSDPSDKFLSRFNKYSPMVKKGSLFNIGEGLLFSLASIKWINKNKAEIYGGYYENPLSSSGNTYHVKRKFGKWCVTKNELHWISKR